MANFLSNKIGSLISTGVDRAESISSNFITTGLSILSTELLDRYSYRTDIFGMEANMALINYLLEFNPKLQKKLVNGLLKMDSLSITVVDENTYVICIVGNPFIDSKEKYIINHLYNKNDDYNPTNVFVTGKHAKRAYNKILKVTDCKNKGLVIYNVSTNSNMRDDDNRESFMSVISDLNERSIDTLFYRDDIKDEIISYIDLFFANREIYRKRNIAFKTGILLYGEPGTGKSSLANAIASKYGLNIVLVNISTFDKLDVQTLTSCFNADNKTYICLLEDIDTLYTINRDEQNENGNTEVMDKDDRKVINKLLQFLDSNSSPDNVIFIATTNYVDKLDEALLREGRFGKKFYIGPITEVEARKMIKSFDCDDEMAENILAKIEDKDHINQSKLQGLILEEFKNREEIDTSVGDKNEICNS